MLQSFKNKRASGSNQSQASVMKLVTSCLFKLPEAIRAAYVMALLFPIIGTYLPTLPVELHRGRNFASSSFKTRVGRQFLAFVNVIFTYVWV